MFVKTGAIARMLGISPHQVRGLEDKGVLKPVCCSPRGTRYYELADVEAYMKTLKDSNIKAEDE